MSEQEQIQEWKPSGNPWLMILPVMLATFMYALDETVANVALPHIAGSYSVSSQESIWVLTSYLMASSIGIPMIDLDKIFMNTPSDQLLNEMKNFLKTYNQKVLLLDNKKTLYAKDSKIDLMEFLKEISLSIPVVATWNGHIENQQLHHIRKDTLEDLVYPVSDDYHTILC